MAMERLRSSLTKGNLWLYILRTLEEEPVSPAEIRRRVVSRFAFTPATITFYSVLYRLRKEGLVRKSAEAFRAAYEITPLGRTRLEEAREYLRKIGGLI